MNSLHIPGSSSDVSCFECEGRRVTRLYWVESLVQAGMEYLVGGMHAVPGVRSMCPYCNEEYWGFYE